jgi:hypothetical protein
LDSKLGLDKLQFLFSTDEVTISPQFPATVDSPRNAATGEELSSRLLYVAGGVPITGRRAYLNTPDYQLTISPHRTGVGSFCSVQFSAGGFSDSNLEPLDYDGCCDVASLVQADLKEKGVVLDLARGLLTRLDVAQNVVLSQPVACYAPALAAVGARKRADKVDFGGTGFVVGNKSWQVGFYDKGAQMKELGYGPSDCPQNTLRPELRFMKSRVIKDALSCGTLPELKRSWPELKPAYKRFLERDVFRPKIEATMDVSVDFLSVAREVCLKSTVHRWQAFGREALPRLLVFEMGLPRAMVFVAEELGIDGATESGKKQLSRIFAQLEKADFALKMHAATTTGHQVKELYNELKRSVLAI